MPPTALHAKLKSSTLADKGVSDAAEAKADEDSRAPAVGKQILVVHPAVRREVHKDRIGMVVSIIGNNNYFSVKFADGSLVSFFASEVDICPSPTALSYLKDNLY